MVTSVHRGASAPRGRRGRTVELGPLAAFTLWTRGCYVRLVSLPGRTRTMDIARRRTTSQRWIALAVVACVVPIAVYCTAGALRWRGRPFPGFFVAENRQLPSAGRFGWTGLAADVPFHARVVTVDGRAVGGADEVYAHAESVPVGTQVHYVFRKDADTIERTVPTMRFGPADFALTSGLFAVNGWLYLVAGALVFFLQPTTRAAAVFFGMSMNLALFPLTAITLYHPLGTWVTMIHFTTQAVLPATLLHLALVFPVERRIAHRGVVLVLAYAVATALAVASIHGFFAEPPSLAAVYAVDLYIALALLVLCGTTASAYVTSRDDDVRRPARTLGVGLVAATAVAVFAFLDNTRGGGRFPMNFVALTPVLYYVALGYAILRHDLFDIDRLVRYAAEYALLTAVITAAYAATLIGVESLVRAEPGRLVTVAFMVALAFAFDPLRRRVQLLVDRTFFRHRPDHAGILGGVSEALATVLDLRQVVERVGAAVREALVVERVAIALWPDGLEPLGWCSEAGGQVAVHVPLRRRLEETRARVARDDAPPDVAAALADDGLVLAQPLVLSGRVIGYVGVGAKRSGRRHEHEDLAFLATLANQAAIAAQNASSYELLEALNRRLEDKVRARTEELQGSNEELGAAYRTLRDTQAQLVQAEKMASLGQLVAGVAHELNNPLTFIVGNIAPVREQLAAIHARAAARGDRETLALCDDMAQILGVIASGAERTTTIVKDLRTFSRLDEGHTALVNLADGLRVTLNLLRPRWKDRITIHVQLDDLPSVECDAAQLNQVFMNVLSNACDAISGPGNIWIRGWTSDDEVAVAVRDDGPGIVGGDLPRIFDPFFTTKAIGKGTGLGLAISHGIVAKHGGRITVSTEPGAGTEFTVWLPLRERRQSVA